MDTDHDIVIATPFGQPYKATRGAQKTITTRSEKISATWLATADPHHIHSGHTNRWKQLLKNDQEWMTPHFKDEIAKRQKLYKLNNMIE